nr:hypothetical protein [Cardiobacterium hominis]
MHGAAIAALLDGINRLSPLPDSCEITLEANPGIFEQANALQFAQDGASVALQHGGNSGGAITLVEQSHYATPLNGRNMTVGIHFRSPAMF